MWQGEGVEPLCGSECVQFVLTMSQSHGLDSRRLHQFMLTENETNRDQKLRLALAKMLPDRITLEQPTPDPECAEAFFWTNPGGFVIRETLDTEWLHVCWLVERGFIHTSDSLQGGYFMALRDIVYKTKHSGISIELAMICSSWEQRAEALCKVKGIDI